MKSSPTQLANMIKSYFIYSGETDLLESVGLLSIHI